MRPRVAFTAWLVAGPSAATPLYICERVSAYCVKPCAPPALEVIAYVRAATAWACRAAAGHDDGDSADTTPATYCSRPIALMASTPPTVPGRNSNHPRYVPSRNPLDAEPFKVSGPEPVTVMGAAKVARRRPDELRRTTWPFSVAAAW